ncbi:hypothetical protein MICRO11B_280033 [Micrococcus luteus]|nr:hypothetical protein MICRO11B_280033 [Micrococcus luteus]
MRRSAGTRGVAAPRPGPCARASAWTRSTRRCGEAARPGPQRGLSCRGSRAGTPATTQPALACGAGGRQGGAPGIVEQSSLMPQDCVTGTSAGPDPRGLHCVSRAADRPELRRRRVLRLVDDGGRRRHHALRLLCQRRVRLPRGRSLGDRPDLP